jgi:hypothetical protein
LIANKVRLPIIGTQIPIYNGTKESIQKAKDDFLIMKDAEFFSSRRIATGLSPDVHLERYVLDPRMARP